MVDGRDAHSRKKALVREEQAKVTAALAKATAEIEVQTARLEQVKQRLMADEIRPAEARRSQMIEEARGQCATLVEEGRANALAIRRLTEVWRQMGDDARKIIVGQNLPHLVDELIGTIGPLNVDRLTFVDADAGSGRLAAGTAVTTEQIQQGLGLDLGRLLSSLAPQPSLSVVPSSPPKP